MPDLKEIYDSRAVDYERLVLREDYEGNIPKALFEILDLSGLDIVELGAGTGRLTCMLAPLVRSIRAYDASAPMLEVARAKLEAGGLTNWHLEVAEHRRLPAPDASADAVISGWSLVYAAIWAQGDWRAELGETFGEINRVLRPGGTIILLETLGTGFTEPSPPADLLDYFGYLDQAGFQSKWIRTDYKFANLEEAHQLVSFFFGGETLLKLEEPEIPAGQLEGTGEVILPECTGLWWKRV